MLFEHKNFLFLFCGVLISGYIINLVVSLLLEWPFRTMGKLVFSAPRRVLLKLKDDLAHELNTNDDQMLYSSPYDEDDSDTSPTSGLVGQIEKEASKSKEEVVTFRTSINPDEDEDFS